MIIKVFHYELLNAMQERARLKAKGLLFDIKPNTNGWRLVRRGWRYNNA